MGGDGFFLWRNLPAGGISLSNASGSVIGQIPKWPTGADCKSAGFAFDGSNPSLPSFSASKVEGRRSRLESRKPRATTNFTRIYTKVIGRCRAPEARWTVAGGEATGFHRQENQSPRGATERSWHGHLVHGTERCFTPRELISRQYPIFCPVGPLNRGFSTGGQSPGLALAIRTQTSSALRISPYECGICCHSNAHGPILSPAC